MSDIDLKRRRAQQRVQMEMARTVGGWMPWACAALALIWWGGTAAFVIGQMGWAEVAALPPLILSGSVAIAFAPGVALILAGVMARESARSREAGALVLTAARELLSPSETAQDGVDTLAGTVTKHTQAVNENLEAARKQVETLKADIQAGAQGAAKAAEIVRSDGEALAMRLREEHDSLRSISEALQTQTDALSKAIPRHAQTMSKAAIEAQKEVEKADGALDQRIASMDNAGKRLAEQIAQLDQMAADSRKRSQNLVSALVRIDEQMLSSSAQVDSAIKAGTLASEASRGTADALREAVSDALDGARKAADDIRASADAAQREAAAAIIRLKEAGSQAETTAKAASMAARSQAEETEQRINQLSEFLFQAASRATKVAEAGLDQARSRIERASNLLNGLDQPETAETPTAAPLARPSATLDDMFEPEDETKTPGGAGFEQFLDPPPPIPNPARAAQKPDYLPRAPIPTPAPTASDDKANAAKPTATATHEDASPVVKAKPDSAADPPQPEGEDPVSWRDFLAGIDDPDNREDEAEALIDQLDRAGVRLKRAVRASDLRRIAAAASRGERQRRRAIRDAAPGELQQVIRVLKQDDTLRGAAENFLALEEPDALKLLQAAERARDDAAPRLSAYLLIDAALS